MDDGRRCGSVPSRLTGRASSPQALMSLAQAAPPGTRGTLRRRHKRACELRLGHAHHLFGEAVCFLLIVVSRLVNRQFRLYRSWPAGECMGIC